MLLRTASVLTGLLIANTAFAETLGVEAARRFVVGKVFTYNCFDGTRGAGRIETDGSVVGTIQMQGSGPVRQAALPAGTLRVKGAAICASVRGIPFEPCFNVEKTNAVSFRGSVQGLSFAYCDFTRRPVRPAFVHTTWRAKRSQPMSIQADTAGKPSSAPTVKRVPTQQVTSSALPPPQ
jgi:hypothetical protein